MAGGGDTGPRESLLGPSNLAGPKLWLSPKFSRTLGTPWSVDSQNLKKNQ